MDNKKELFQKFIALTTSVHQVTYDFTKDIKYDDITPLQYRILEYMAVSQPSTLSEISLCMHMSMPNTSREIKKLSEKQLIEKFDAADDKRKQYIQLSKKGQALMDDAFLHIETLFLERINTASEEDLEQLSKAIDILQAKVFF
ncbi:MarR family winged helix-turn-helix transcriptional regulator [Paenibacillus sp. L3-i20]|uniref:MarR family winged helix-turn-helix transcriptional regulator n=1 Tax=Paenibacillus sp. L3-i20 TaxID=2905833 RepID=UPI001EE03296|nr:MarR family transcriptional regulator [Paenibacillus sp. L3-i20]GKU77465.1 hypothetical protein L3i20_v218620 [Paenibacillus sp. L3-i20]